MRRARITADNTRRVYADLLDRVLAERGEKEVGAAAAAAPAPTVSPSSRPGHPTPPSAPPRRPERQEPTRVKATFYLHPSDVITIDRIQMQEFLRTSKKPQRSEIVSRALRLLAAQELRGEPAELA
jgi:hypothetical protein